MESERALRDIQKIAAWETISLLAAFLLIMGEVIIQARLKNGTNFS